MQAVFEGSSKEGEGEEMKILSGLLLCAALSFGQQKGKAKTAPPKPPPAIEWTQCVEPVEAHGGHVRWTPEETIQLLLNERNSRMAQDVPYIRWENASRDLDWFSGTKRVPLVEIKSHMPRAMLLELRFPVDQNPPVDPKGLEVLIAAEKAYEETTKGIQDYPISLLKKYGVGPQAILDQDYGGATAQGGCNRYEKVAAK